MVNGLQGYYAILDLVVDAAAAAAGGAADVSSVEPRAERLLAGRPCCLQLRAKGATAATVRDAALRLRPLCRAAAVPLCIDDRLDVALLVGAEVVHLGQDDLPLAEARRLAAGRLLIGFSTHNLDQALAAARGGADYIGFGPIFGTRSKRDPDPTVGLEALRAVAAAVAIPVVAIGGITLAHIAAVAATGAAAAAVISAVDQSPDPAATGRAITAAFAAARPAASARARPPAL
jgi:thiamine-phosphate pyrophosphorylase